MTRMKSKPGLVPARKQGLFRRLHATLKREDIANCLVATGNARADRLLDMMLDPAYASLSFGQLCSRAGLSGADVMRLYGQRQMDVGMMRIAQHLPDLMEEVALAALSRDEPCERCEGEGNPDGAKCARCHGTGTIRVLGDKHALKLVFAMNGLIR